MAKKNNTATIVVSALLGLVIVLSGAFAGVQVGSVNSHTLAFESATQQALSANVEASTSRSVAAGAETQLVADRGYKTSCLYDYFCSVATYRIWISLVNAMENKVSEANSVATMWDARARELESTASYEHDQRKSAEQLRNLAFGGVGVGVFGLLGFLLMMRARNKRASV